MGCDLRERTNAPSQLLRLKNKNISEILFVCVVVLISEHLQRFPNISPIPIKLLYWEQLCFFLTPPVSQYLSIFLWPPIFPPSLLKERRYNSSNTMGTIRTITFQPYFLLYFCRTNLSYGYWTRYIEVLLQQLSQ